MSERFGDRAVHSACRSASNFDQSLQNNGLQLAWNTLLKIPGKKQPTTIFSSCSSPNGCQKKQKCELCKWVSTLRTWKSALNSYGYLQLGKWFEGAGWGGSSITLNTTQRFTSRKISTRFAQLKWLGTQSKTYSGNIFQVDCDIKPTPKISPTAEIVSQMKQTGDLVVMHWFKPFW